MGGSISKEFLEDIKPMCEVCKKVLTSDFAVVEKNGNKIWVCEHHPRPKVR